MREDWIDAAKGFGIILVMMLHSCGMPSIAGCSFTPGVIPVFFVLAGLTFKQEDIKTGIIKKSKRLLIPYFFYSLATILFATLYFGDHGHIFDRLFGVVYGRYYLYPYYVENNRILMMETAPMWFLLAMFLSFVWLYCFHNIKNKYLRFSFLSILVIVPFLTQKLPYLMPWSLDTSTFFTLFILIGEKMKRVLDDIIKKSVILNFVYVLVALFLFYILRSYNGTINISIRQYGNLGFVSVVLLFILGVLESFSIMSVAKLLSGTIIIKALSVIGHHSMRLMCIHYFIFLIVSNILRVNVKDGIIALALIILSFLISILLKKLYDLTGLTICKYL